MKKSQTDNKKTLGNRAAVDTLFWRRSPDLLPNRCLYTPTTVGYYKPK